MERIINEYKELHDNPITNCGITVGLLNENDYRVWRVTMLGPKDTPYQGGFFWINIKFPEEYPIKPPVAYFITPIYHPNINPKAQRSSEDKPLGYINISILNYWKPKNTIKELLVNIFGLLNNPNFDCPYGLEIAEEFIKNRAIYEEKVKRSKKKYANPFKGDRDYKRTQDWDFEFNYY